MKAGPGWSKLSLRLTPPLTQDEFAQSPLGVFAPGGLVQKYSAYRTESRRFNRKVRVAVALFVSHAFHLRKDGHRRGHRRGLAGKSPSPRGRPCRCRSARLRHLTRTVHLAPPNPRPISSMSLSPRNELVVRPAPSDVDWGSREPVEPNQDRGESRR